MRIISVDSVKGTELLARDIITGNDSILVPAGTVIKKDYKKRLKELDIEYIYVEDEIGQGINLIDSLELQIKEQCQKTVKEILLKYSYHYEDKLEDIKQIADEIILDVLKEPEVIYNLSSIRNKSESTYSHSLNVCALSVILALRLKVVKSSIRHIAIGALLHDIGFTYITLDYQNLNTEECTEKELKNTLYMDIPL